MRKSVKYVGLCLALISAGFAFTGCNEEPVDVTMSQIYDANQTTALLQSFEKIGAVKTDRNEVKTETYLDGVIYYETVTTNDAIVRACYNKAGTIGYQKDADGTYYALFLQADALKVKPEKAYVSQIFDDRTLALQEEIVSATVKGDAIQVKTKLSADNSAIVFTADGYAYENGEYVEAEYSLDKQTNRVLTAKRSAVKTSGATTLYEMVEQKTAVSSDGEIATLKARVQAVETNTNLRKMTIALDPNTVNEQLYSAYAYGQDKFKIDFGAYYTQLYTDDKCETPYQFTESDVRKAFMKLYAKKVIPPVECDFTMQDIISANNIETWLQDGDTVLVQSTYGGMRDTMYFDTEKTYINTYNLIHELSYERVFYTDGTFGYTKSMDNYVAYVGVGEPIQYNKALFFESSIEKEQIYQLQEDNGKLLLTTKVAEEDVQAVVRDEYQDGDYWLIEYTLDVRTYRINSAKFYVMHADGTKVCSSSIEVKVNEAEPTGVTELCQRLTATENVRKVTILTNPGETNMQVIRFNVIKGDALTSETYALYTDFNCTQVYEDTSQQEDELVLYAKPIE